MTIPARAEGAAERWRVLEAEGLRETFLLAAPSGSDREQLKRRLREEFESLLERYGFAADHGSTMGALVGAAGREQVFLAELLAAAAQAELSEGEEHVAGKRQLTRVRRMVQTLERLAGDLMELAASFEAGAQEAEGEARIEAAR